MSLDHVSAEFQEGYRAFDNGDDKNECPYDNGTVLYADWRDGWECAEDDIGYEKDERHLDDPRRGQAQGLNAWKRTL